ncbi:hypothetical protein GCM10023191_034150 [Actinoallomurus oryzae]|uniref:Uncharacterized protein n=1 Tax=Actinoallomurus oryzae TaxID=502180 RepID=A0ABP8PY27_9ACTN
MVFTWRRFNPSPSVMLAANAHRVLNDTKGTINSKMILKRTERKTRPAWNRGGR